MNCGVFLLILSLISWPADEYTRLFEKNLTLGEKTVISIDNVSGALDITGTTGRELQIRATKIVKASSRREGEELLDEFKIEVTEGSGKVNIETIYPRRHRFSGHVDYILEVPVDSRMKVHLVSGDANIMDLEEDIEVDVVSADVTCGDIDGDIDVSTISGDIYLEKVYGDFRLKTISGDIIAELAPIKDKEYQINSTSGDIKVRIPEDADFEVHATAVSGDVVTNLPISIDRVSRTKIRGYRGSDGPLIKLSTISGDVKLLPSNPKTHSRKSIEENDEMKHYHKKVGLEDETSAEIKLEFGVGRFNLEKGKALIETDIKCEPEEFTPTLEYKKSDKVGVARLRMVREKGGIRIKEWQFKNRCDVHLTPEIPLDLDISLGACGADIDLTDIRVQSLHLETGASKTELFIEEENPIICDDVDIEAGAAQFRAEGLNNLNFKRLHFSGGVGAYTLDFGEPFEGYRNADIEMGVGSISLILPRDVGIRMKVDGLFIKDIEGLRRDGKWYTSRDFNEQPGKLSIHVEGGLGTLNVTLR